MFVPKTRQTFRLDNNNFVDTHTHIIFLFKMRTNNTRLQSSPKSIQLIKALRKEIFGKFKKFYNQSPMKSVEFTEATRFKC